MQSELEKLRKYLQIAVGTDRILPGPAREIMKQARQNELFNFDAWLSHMRRQAGSLFNDFMS